MSGPSRKTVLSLYRRLLRLHQKLPSNMSALGLMFVREEFKKHAEASSDHATAFIKEWTDFAISLESQVNASGIGIKGQSLSGKDVELLNDAQLLQLSELHKETTKPSSTT